MYRIPAVNKIKTRRLPIYGWKLGSVLLRLNVNCIVERQSKTIISGPNKSPVISFFYNLVDIKHHLVLGGPPAISWSQAVIFFIDLLRLLNSVCLVTGVTLSGCIKPGFHMIVWIVPYPIVPVVSNNFQSGTIRKATRTTNRTSIDRVG